MDGRQAISITNGEFGRLAERSLAIHERNEFERWCRRDLQGFLPHTTLLCARGDLLLDSHQIEHLFEPPDAEIDDTQRRESEETLLGALLAAWRHRHGVPLIIRPQDLGKGTRRSALAAELARHGYRDCSAHGLLDQESGAGAFFVFLGGLNEPRESRARRLELLVPHLYATLQRVLHAERLASLEDIDTQSLSPREAQILRWVRAGKTNQQIALILNISPYTVKNHVQSILRKMKVANRAQAAVFAVDSVFGDPPDDPPDSLSLPLNVAGGP